MIRYIKPFVGALTGLLFASATFADSIDPADTNLVLEVGESQTITYTVTIDDAPPSSGLIDIMFLIDTSGSMGAEIAAAKAAASDIFTALDAFGDVNAGSGFFSDPGFNGVKNDLTSNSATAIAGINGIFLGEGGGGGDFPEKGIAAVAQAANTASWRENSARFIIALGDANNKNSDGVVLADAQAALAANNVTLIGVNYGSMNSTSSGGIPWNLLTDPSGGSVVNSSGLSVSDLVDDITDGLTDAFSTYSSVTVSNLGAALPFVSTSVECVTADTGVCNGAFAEGSYDRSIERTFTFDVTYTGLEVGETGPVDVLGLVDSAATATADSSFRVIAPRDRTDVPEPAPFALLASALIAVAAVRRKKQK